MNSDLFIGSVVIIIGLILFGVLVTRNVQHFIYTNPYNLMTD